MKRKTIILAVVAAAAMALTLVGCGVKITNIAVPESAMVEKGESITLPVVYGTDDAIVNIKTGEVLVDRVHDRTYAIDDVDDYNKFLPYARKQVQAWEAKDGKMIFYILPPRKKANAKTDI